MVKSALQINLYTLLSPVGNRVKPLDLIKNKTETIDSIQARYNIRLICLAPDNRTIFLIDDENNLYCHFLKGLEICDFRPKKPVYCCQFSPDSKYFNNTR